MTIFLFHNKFPLDLFSIRATMHWKTISLNNLKFKIMVKKKSSPKKNLRKAKKKLIANKELKEVPVVITTSPFKTLEEDHLKNVSETVKEIYLKIKTELQKTDKTLLFNSQKYYVSLKKVKNIAFFHFSTKKLSIVIMQPEKEIRKKIKHHLVRTLAASVQKFWNGECATVVIEQEKYLQEVTSLIKKIIV